MKRMKIRKMPIGEKIIYAIGITSFVMLMLTQYLCGAQISTLSMNIEQIKYDITQQEKTNESLAMQVNELTSFDKINSVVKEKGLAYNNDNVVVVGE